MDELERRITDPIRYPRENYPIKGIWEYLFNVYGRFYRDGISGAYADQIIRLARRLAQEDCERR